MFKKLRNDRNLILLIFIVEIVIAIAMVIISLVVGKDSNFSNYALYILIAYFILINVANIFLISQLLFKTEKYLNRTDITIASIFGNEVAPVFEFGDLVIFVYNEVDEVIWVSQTNLLKKDEILGQKIYDLIPDFDELAVKENSDEVYAALNGKTFQIEINTGLKVVYLKDVSARVIQSQKFEDDRPFIGHVVIDNYQDIIIAYGESDFASFSTDVKQAILDWSKKYNLFLRSYSNDSYLIVGDEKNYQEILKGNFSIMDDVRKLAKTKDNPLTVSIGIGKGNTTSILRTSELSYTALNMALARGGDQVVVNVFGKPYEYYGAKNEVKQTRSHVRGRVLAASLANLVKSHKDVIIMGHKNMDFDALGASLGIYTICEALKAKSYIVYEESLVEKQTKTAFADYESQQEMKIKQAKTAPTDNESQQDKKIKCLTPAKALQVASEQTLVIVVDTHRPDSTMQPKILEKCKDVAVIDHHRKGDQFILNPEFEYHEPQSSSASELVTELIYYQNTKIPVKEEIANFLLAGICLDTKFFKSGASGKTFEMAMHLKQYSASVEAVNEFFKEEYEELKLSSTIISSMRCISTGIYIACDIDDSDIITRTSLSKVAEEILETKGIQAIFVVGRTGNNEVSVSARSKNDFNVQIIMEKMHGGGHFSKAATQVLDTTVEAVCKEVDNYVRIYLRDNRI